MDPFLPPPGELKRTITPGTLSVRLSEEGTLSTFGAASNLIAGAVGAGVLAMPAVMGYDGQARAGVLGGLGLLLVATFFQRVANRTLAWALRTASEERGKMVCTLGDLATVALGPRGTQIASCMSHTTNLGFATTYIILLGDISHRQLGYPKWLSTAVAGAALFPLTFMPLLGWLGSVAVGTELVVILLVVAAAAMSMPCENGWSQMGPLDQFGPAFCTIVFALGFGFLVPMAYGSLRDRNDAINTVTDLALGAQLLIYFVIMCLCYYAWGDDVKGNVMDSIPEAYGWMRPLADGLLSVHLVIAYGVMMRASLEPFGIKGCGTWAVAMRLGLAIVVAAIATGIPCFNEFIGLVAAVTLVFCNYVLPFACYWKLRSQRHEPSADGLGFKVLHGVVVLGGLVAMAVGFVQGLRNLQDALAPASFFQDHNNTKPP